VIGVSVCPSPNGEGMVLTSFRLIATLVFQVNVSFEEVLASPPWGRRERGLCATDLNNAREDGDR